MKIGIFDSGLGGLTVLRRLRERLPQADLIFFSDQAHLPYGERSSEDLFHLLRENLGILEGLQVDAIAMGCNTSCAIAMEFGWPTTSAKVFDLVDAGANMVFTGCHFSTAVIATTATVRSGVYQKYIHRRQDLISVVEIAAPELVPMIEQSASRMDLHRAVRTILSAITTPVQSLVLGCSHYALIADIFAELMPGAALIDPSIGQADAVAAFARITAREGEGNATIRAWTNGEPEVFERTVAALGFHLPGMSFGPPVCYTT